MGHFNAVISDGDHISYDSTQQVVGIGSYQFDSGNGTVEPSVAITGVLGNTRRVSTYFRYDSVPDSVVTASQFAQVLAVYSGDGFDGDFTSDNDAYATATPARNSGSGNVLGFSGLAVPAGALILSVKIIYERKYDTADSIGIARVKYRLDGIEGPDHDNTNEPTTDTIVEVDVTGDRTWEWQDLQPAVFAVIVEARRGDTDTAHTQSWDYVKVEVEYHYPAWILEILNSTDQMMSRIALSPRETGVVLRFADGAGASYDGITLLLPDTWYRISFAYTYNDLNDLDIAIFVNGIPELVIEEAHTNDISLAFNLQYGWITTPGEDHLCWFDQLYIDDGDDLQDPGNALTTAKLPATLNENDWNATIGTGAVDERPLSETNGKQHTSVTGVRQTYTLQAAATGDIDISGESLLGYMGWAWAKRGSGGTEDVYLVVNGVDIPKNVQLTTTSSLLHHVVTSTTYPSDAAGVGMVSNNETADTFMYECGAVVAYEGPINPDILLERQLVNNETLATIIDDLRADPPDSYEVCCEFDDFDGSVQITIHSLDQDGGSLQKQPGLDSRGRVRIMPGVEVRLDVTVVGVTNLQIWRRLNVD